MPAGEYSLYSLVGEHNWKLIINKQTGQWGTEYNQAHDLGRIKMAMSKPDSPIETYQIALTSTGGNKGLLKLAWEHTIATVPFTVK